VAPGYRAVGFGGSLGCCIQGLHYARRGRRAPRELPRPDRARLPLPVAVASQRPVQRPRRRRLPVRLPVTPSNAARRCNRRQRAVVQQPTCLAPRRYATGGDCQYVTPEVSQFEPCPQPRPDVGRRTHTGATSCITVQQVAAQHTTFMLQPSAPNRYHMYRTSIDICPFWKSVIANLMSVVPFLGEPPLSRPGQWAYPGMPPRGEYIGELLLDASLTAVYGCVRHSTFRRCRYARSRQAGIFQ
jgi:hypothetical protein